MNYVIMFVPHSEALWTALREDTGLWREAMNQNVYIADEQTLYAALSIINMTWTQILQEEKQQELYQCAQEMLDRVGLFAKSYQEIGKSLESVQKAYRSGWTKLREDGRSIGTSCRKMLKLGVQQGKNPLPAGMIDVDDIQALEDNTVLSDNDVIAEAAGTDNAE
jgi:DNA recombination protein RmuC